MRFALLTASQDGPCHPEHALAALTEVLTPERLQQALAAAGLHTQRQRKLPFEAGLWLVMGMSLIATAPIPAVWDRLIAGLRLLCLQSPTRVLTVVTPGALCSRRYQLGVRPLRRLFRRVCRRLATATTRGAFLGPFRLLACDGHHHDVPDTPANVRAFGRPTGGRGDSAFPQVLGMYLCECGTHAVVDAPCGPCTQSEHQVVRHVRPSPVLDLPWRHSLELGVDVGRRMGIGRRRCAAALRSRAKTTHPLLRGRHGERATFRCPLSARLRRQPGRGARGYSRKARRADQRNSSSTGRPVLTGPMNPSTPNRVSIGTPSAWNSVAPKSSGVTGLPAG